jgi:hypothetical protein
MGHKGMDLHRPHLLALDPRQRPDAGQKAAALWSNLGRSMGMEAK